MKKKRKYIMIAVIVIVAIISVTVGGILIWKSIEKYNEERQHKDPRQCVERKLEIELGEGVTFVEGTAYDERYNGKWGEERVKAKFEVEREEVERLKQKLGDCLWKYEIDKLDPEEIKTIKRIKEARMDLSDKTIIDYYEQCREGKRAKTIVIEAFIVTDDAGDYYFYIFY